MNKLQIALLSNGLFSVISGITLITFSGFFSTLFTLDSSLIFSLIGAGLILFSGAVFIETKKQRYVQTLVIIFQDLLWVISSWLLLWLQPFGISDQGNQIILYISLIVLFFGLTQSHAVSALDTNDNGQKTVTFERVVKASKERSWQVVSDVANFHHYAALDSVRIISGSEYGMQRNCVHGKKSWNETCTIWDEGEKYVFEVDTNAPDYPYPFKHLEGTFQVIAIDDKHSKIMLSFNFEFTRRFPYHLIYPLMKLGFIKSTKKLMDNWQKEIEHSESL